MEIPETKRFNPKGFELGTTWNILQIVSSFSLRLECQTVVSLLLTDLNDSRKRIAAKASIIVFETTNLTQFYSSFPQSLRANVLILEQI